VTALLVLLSDWSKTGYNSSLGGARRSSVKTSEQLTQLRIA
jgi:hypothetical protein